MAPRAVTVSVAASPGRAPRRRPATRHPRDALPALAAARSRYAGPAPSSGTSSVRCATRLGDLEGALEAEQRAAGAHPDPEKLGRRIIALLRSARPRRRGRHRLRGPRAPRATDPTWALELVERELRRGLRKPADAHFDAAAALFSAQPVGDDPPRRAGRRALGRGWRARAAWERAHARAARRAGDPRARRDAVRDGQAGARRCARSQALRAREPSAVARGAVLRLAEVLLEARSAHGGARRGRRRARARPTIRASTTCSRRSSSGSTRPTRPCAGGTASSSSSAGGGRQSERREARTRNSSRCSRARRPGTPRRARARPRRNACDARPTIARRRSSSSRPNSASAATPAPSRPAVGSSRDAAAATSRAARTTTRTPRRRARARAPAARERPDRGGRAGSSRKLATRAPTRAREAHVQIADVELARHDETDALAHAEQAAQLAPGDEEALARIAAIEERAGARGARLRHLPAPSRRAPTRRQASRSRRCSSAAATPSGGRRRAPAARDRDRRRGDPRGRPARDRARPSISDVSTSSSASSRAGSTPSRAPPSCVACSSRSCAVSCRRSIGRGRRTPRRARRGVARARTATPARARRRRGGRPDRALVELSACSASKDAAPVLARLAAPATVRRTTSTGGHPRAARRGFRWQL